MSASLGLRSRSAAAVVLALTLAACRQGTPARTVTAERREAATLPTTLLSADWEGGVGAWTTATTSGTSNWHIVTHPEQLKVIPALYPGAAVLLPDDGGHLPARGGTNVMWFGLDATGTYVGSGYTIAAYGTSTAAQTGTLTSPPVALTAAAKNLLEFDAWWEIEGQGFQGFDKMIVQLSSDGGSTFQQLGILNPAWNPGIDPVEGFTSGGPSMRPAWRHYAFDLSAWAGQTVNVRFLFDADTTHNAFRGWTIDNVAVSSGGALPAPVITGVWPAAGTKFASMWISGAGFLEGATVKVGGIPVPAIDFTSLGAGLLFVATPDLVPAGVQDVQVVNPDGQVATLSGVWSSVSGAVPNVTGVTPGTGTAGTPTAVNLFGFGLSAGVATLHVGDYNVTTFNVQNDSAATATFPPLGPGTYNVMISGVDGQVRTHVGIFTVPTVTDTSTIAVTAPNGGEAWAIGSTQPITYTATGVTSVAIELWRDGVFDRRLASGVTGGTWSWTLPADLLPGATYRVTVANEAGQTMDWSDNTFTVSGSVALALKSGGGQSATVGAAFTNPVCFHADDGATHALENLPVTFTFPGSGATGVLARTAVVTNASGDACVGVTAGQVVGAWTLTAKTGSVSATAGLTNTVGAPATVAVQAGDAQSATVNTAFSAALQVKVTDTYGNVVPGAVVTYAAPVGAVASATLSATTATTSAAGLASVTATANTKSGGFAVTASVAGVVTPASFALTNNPGAQTGVAVVTGGGQSATVNTGFTTALQAKVSDTYGNGVPGVTVTFTAPASGAKASLSAPSAVTAADGTASVNATAGTVAGGYNVTAAAAGVATPASFALTNTAGPPATVTIVGGGTQSATVNTAFAAGLQVRVDDQYGNVVSGATVGYAAPAGAGVATATVPATATTSAAGLASVTATAGTVVGSYSVTATVGVLPAVTFSLTNNPGAASQVTVVAGGTQSATVNTAFATGLQVRVQDQYSNAVPGVTVSYAAPATGAKATLSSATAVTSAAGLASVNATAGTVAGSYAVTATVGALPAASFALTNAPGAASVVVKVAGDGQSATVNTGFATALQVRVDDAFSNPVPNVTVTFAAPGTGASAALSAASATTSAGGTASVTATANTKAGAYAVTASAAGASSASFSLTNSTGAAASVTIVAGSPQSAVVGAAFATGLQVRVDDAFANPVQGVTVTYAPPASGAGVATSSLSATTATTSAAGTASVTATAGLVAGSYTVTATAAGVATPVGFALTNTAGPAAALVKLSGDAQSATVNTAFAAALEVRVDDAHGNPVPNATVTFAAPASGARAALSATTATTSAAGTASVTATAGTVTGSYAVTATVTGVATPASFGLTNAVGAASVVVRVAGDGQSATVNTAFATALQVKVTDAFGNGVPGAQVAFAAPASGAKASLSSTTETTSAAGTASVTATAGTVAGSYAVTATASGVATPASFALTNDPGPAAAVATLAGSTPQTAESGGFPFQVALGVRATDAFGNPVPGVTVTWSAPASGARAILSATTKVTAADGTASVTATTGNTSGSYAVTASIPGGHTATFDLTNAVGVPAALLRVSGDAQSATVGAAFAASLVVRVNDARGNPIQGAAVAFAAPATGARAVLSGTAVTTDAAGEARVTATAGTVAGTYQVIATAAGVATPVTFDLANQPGAAAAIAAASAGATQSATVGATFGQALAVTVKDAFGNGVPSVTVTWASPATGATAVLLATTATTDASGAAQVSARAGDVAGAYVVNATAPGVSSPAAFSLTNLPGAPSTLAVQSGGSQQAAAGTAFAAPLVVLVRDAHQNPVPGVEVAFAAPASGARATLSASTATTGAAGTASVTATAGTVAGGYDVTATVAGAASPAVLALTNLPGAPAAISAGASSSGQSARVGEAFPAALVATVRDAFGNAVPGVTVAFACPASGAGCTLSAASRITDAQGAAQVTATAGTTPGAYAATATVTGLTAATYDLTNLVGLPGSIAITSGNPQSAGVLQAFAAPLQVAVRDAYQNPVPGVAVAYAVVNGGAVQAATLSAASATTDAAGLASVTATANAGKGAYEVRATAPGVAAPAVFALTNTGVPAVVTAQVDLEVLGSVLSAGGGVAHLTIAVGPVVGGLSPGGTVTITGPEPIVPVPGQEGVATSGAGVTATVVHGEAQVDLTVKSWRAQTLTLAFAPSTASSVTWDPGSGSVKLVAAAKQDAGGGGCSTGGAGGLALLPLLGLALRRRRRLLPFAAALAVVVTPGLAAAQVEVGARLGLGLPVGDAVKSAPLSRELSWQLPIQLEAEARPFKKLPALAVGGYLGYGVGGVGDVCVSSASCSGHTLDLGVQATWHFPIVKKLGASPWAGAGLGYGWAADEVSIGGDERTVKLRGPQLRLMGGAEWRLRDRFAVGPFVQCGIGRYGWLEVSSPLGTSSGAPPDAALHAWLGFGVRGAFEVVPAR
ncbi:MAG: Ig-like domain-containing protein [Anaeromyxobacter sp.]